MWWVTSQKNGVSALGLQQVLGWGSYQTAWTCLHKLRRAMIRPGRERLAGAVEVDESYLGGTEEGVRGRQTEDKALIVVAAEEDGRGIGRIRLRHIRDASSSSLLPFVKDSIEPGSTVHTDGWLGYLPLEANAYRHRITYLKDHAEQASDLLPRVHRVFSLLKSSGARTSGRRVLPSHGLRRALSKRGYETASNPCSPGSTNVRTSQGLFSARCRFRSVAARYLSTLFLLSFGC